MMRFIYASLTMATAVSTADTGFRHHFIDKTLPQNERLQGDYGITALVDLDRDGDLDFVLGGRQPPPDRLYCDADIELSRIVILRNPDGKGAAWTKQELPQSFPCGSLHSLTVADFNLDGRLDIVCNEQEELLPPGRRNPRWILWENPGKQKFAERILLDTKLGGHELQSGDVDGDGDIDIVSKAWGCLPWNGTGGKMHVDFLENLVR